MGVLTLPQASQRRQCTYSPGQRPVACAVASLRPTRPRARSGVACRAAVPFLNFSSPDSYNVPSTSGRSPPYTPQQQQQQRDTGYRINFSSHYTRGQQMGQGSFGTVYRGAARQNPQCEVAIKVMSKVRGKLTKEATLEKICREVDFLERLQGCRGVVNLVDCFEEPDEVLVVMELCSGGDLQRLADTYPTISERCLALIALEVLRIIRACNDVGVVHGDVKPANFVLKHPLRNPLFSLDPELAATSWLKAIDVGCSQMLPGPDSYLSKRAGTPVFMAPEIFARNYGREADVWSAGVLLYQVFSKRFPFWDTYEAAKASRIDDIAQAVCNSEIRLDWGPWVTMSPEGRDFIRGLLTRDPEERMTTQEALSHPWLLLALGAVPPAAPAGGRGGGSGAGNNIVRCSPHGVGHRAGGAGASAIAA